MGATDRIIADLLPEFAEHQRQKAKDYNGSLVPGVENADVLGARGQYAELWRKMAKLKKSLWDGEALIGEQPREILLDFIGHCFLAIDMLDRQQMAEDPPMPSAGPLGESDKLSDRGRLRLMTGHGYDGCSVCARQVEVIAASNGGKFDWEQDIP